jgi:GT2 family glycosyltransferase
MPLPRPAVSVVMPFTGDRVEAERAAAGLARLNTAPGDELLLVDNAGSAANLNGVTVIPAPGERSPAHARNVGAQAASGEWILFLDADCRPVSDLLDAYFSAPIADRVGALAGEVIGVAEPASLAARYGAARGFLSQRQHLAHPYLPRAVAANLLVRRAAFEQVGGFYEGLRAAEDTDFTWRLQHAGWRLELRPQASVEHRHRATLNELRRQWRGYAAGRAWLARRYDGFVPELPLSRALNRARRSLKKQSPTPPARRASRLDRGRYAAIDALLGLEELAGLTLSNRPRHPGGAQGAHVVLVAERFPVPGDPLIELARTLEGARVEAAGRPAAVSDDRDGLRIDYREDDGLAERLSALAWLFARHPLRALRDHKLRGPGQASLTSLAPVVKRLERDPGARVQPLGGGEAPAVARRLQELAGRN